MHWHCDGWGLIPKSCQLPIYAVNWRTILTFKTCYLVLDSSKNDVYFLLCLIPHISKTMILAYCIYDFFFFSYRILTFMLIPLVGFNLYSGSCRSKGCYQRSKRQLTTALLMMGLFLIIGLLVHVRGTYLILFLVSHATFGWYGSEAYSFAWLILSLLWQPVC